MRKEFEDSPWRDAVTLGLGDVSERLSASGFLKLASSHGGPSVGQVRVTVLKPGDAEAVAAGVSAYERYCAGVGGSTFDGRPLPDFTDLGERQKAGWCAAGGVPSHHNPYMPGSGG